MTLSGTVSALASVVITGIIAAIAGSAPGAYDADGNPARRIALRTDIDALPIRERTDLDFISQNEGVMHACGHDCHMAMMLGAVRILNELRAQLRGEVRVIFQPAEEISIGARDMIAAGALDGVDAIYGAHIWSEVDAGTFSVKSAWPPALVEPTEPLAPATYLIARVISVHWANSVTMPLDRLSG